MKHFVVNLKRRPDRLALFRSRCPIPQEDVEVVAAFDGKNPGDESPEEQEFFHKMTSLVVGARGCFISHIRIFKKMVDESIPVAQIFEDDCEFLPNFAQAMSEIQFPESFHVFYNGGRFTPNFLMPDHLHRKVAPNVALHTFDHGKQGFYHDRTTHAYILSLEGAKMFLDVFNRANLNSVYPLDGWMDVTCHAQKIPVYSSIPLLCHTPNADSDIV